MPAIESLVAAGSSALVVTALIWTTARFILVLVVIVKVPADKLAAVLRALALVFRARRK